MAKANKVQATQVQAAAPVGVAVYAGSNPPPVGAALLPGKVQWRTLPDTVWLAVTPAGHRYTGKAGTKHGALADDGTSKGTAGTWAAIKAIAMSQGGHVTKAQAIAVELANNDKGYTGYAVSKGGWLAPVADLG